MAEPAAPESPKPGVERSTAGLVVALYLAAAVLLIYITYQIVVESKERLAPVDPDSAASIARTLAPPVATALTL